MIIEFTLMINHDCVQQSLCATVLFTRELQVKHGVSSSERQSEVLRIAEATIKRDIMPALSKPVVIIEKCGPSLRHIED